MANPLCLNANGIILTLEGWSKPSRDFLMWFCPENPHWEEAMPLNCR